MAHTTLGITGATGRIGGAVSRRLEERGVAHRLLVRSPHRVASHVAAANGLLDAATMDFADPDRVLRGPAGDGRVAAVARADVVDAALAVLFDPRGHERAAYTLTGPSALTLDEMARIMTRVTGQDHRYEPETLDEARASRAGHDPEPWQVGGWLSTDTAIASGELSRVTNDVETLTGHAPRSLEDVLRGA